MSTETHLGGIVTTELTDDEMHSGQVRIANRFAERNTHRLIHVYGIGWHYWDGTRYAFDDRGRAHHAVVQTLKAALEDSLDDKKLRADVARCETASGIDGVLKIAAAMPQFATTVADLDRDPYLLNCENGTLDLRDGMLRAHDPADRITKRCNAAYDPDAPGGTWKSFLARVLPNEQVRNYLQRLVGLALIGEVREHLLSIWTGSGANGKGVAYGAIVGALGDYAGPAEPDLFMHRDGAHPTGQMDLLGKRFVVVSESDQDRRLAEATMKRLTGGDQIKARYMRQNFVQFTPSHTAMLVTNHLPRVSGDDPAIWRRIRVIPFDVVIPEDEQDSGLPAALQAEAETVLAWAVAGLNAYQRIGLAEPAEVLAATDAYQADSDTVGRFIAERCHLGPMAKATTTDLFDAWQRWCTTEGIPALGRKAFGQSLDHRGYPASDPSGGKRWRSGIGVVIDQIGGGGT